MERTFHGDISLAGLQTSTRFRDFDVTFSASGSLFGIIFGGGLAATNGYLPGYQRAYQGFGVIGLVMMVVLMYRLWRRGNGTQRKIALIYAVLNIGTEVFWGSFAMLYCAFLLTDTASGGDRPRRRLSRSRERIGKRA